MVQVKKCRTFPHDEDFEQTDYSLLVRCFVSLQHTKHSETQTPHLTATGSSVRQEIQIVQVFPTEKQFRCTASEWFCWPWVLAARVCCLILRAESEPENLMLRGKSRCGTAFWPNNDGQVVWRCCRLSAILKWHAASSTETAEQRTIVVYFNL